MRYLEKSIDEYLSKPTDYAIQIVGGWGNGKTFFYRNFIEKLIYSKTTYVNDTKTYKPIYISLFGMKSIEDIATKIVLDFYKSKYFKLYLNKTRKKALSITEDVLHIALRGFLNFTRLGNLDDYTTNVKNIGKETLDTTELVICFDDLERKDSSLKIEDLTGYINTLVDEKIKVLIICNEDIFLKEDPNYKHLKEKLIGITLEFNPNPSETLKSIIEVRYSSFPVSRDYLLNLIEELSLFSKAIDNNFRHLIYALDCLQYIYSRIKKEILDSKHEIKEKLQQNLLGISKLIIALAIEYKSSILKHSDINDYTGNTFLEEIFRNTQNFDSKEKNEEGKLKKFLKKYHIEKKEYHLYESIFNYITGFNEFDIQSFIKEFDSRFNLKNGTILPQYNLLNQLSYSNYYNLSDEEYKQNTLQMIQYAKNGLYQPIDYFTVIHNVERFDNILKLDLDATETDLIQGLKKSIDNAHPKSDSDFSKFEITAREVAKSEIAKRVHKAGSEHIKFLSEKKKEEKISHILDLLLKKPNEFHKKYLTDESFKYSLHHYDLFSDNVSKDLLETIKKSDGDFIYFLLNFFEERYQYEEKRKQESMAIEILIKGLRTYQDDLEKKENQKIRKQIISELLQRLTTIVDRLN